MGGKIEKKEIWLLVSKVDIFCHFFTFSLEWTARCAPPHLHCYVHKKMKIIFLNAHECTAVILSSHIFSVGTIHSVERKSTILMPEMISIFNSKVFVYISKNNVYPEWRNDICVRHPNRIGCSTSSNIPKINIIGQT